MSTITKEFTKEQLQQIEAAAKEVMWPVVWSEKKAREHFSEKITPKVVLKLARIALASLEEEPVADWTNEQCLEFLSIAFRHAEINGDLQFDDIRLGVKMVNGSRAAMLQGAEPVTTAYKLPEATGSSLQLRNLIRQRHAEWSQSTFGDVGPVGPLKHLSKEALEAAAEPEDLSEWADMQFLLWDAQRRAGISDGDITAAMEEKLKVNMARQWPEPKDGEPRLHIKADGNSPVIPDGWVMLPAEPTQAMMNAWLSEVANWRGHAAGYRAMIAAAPQQEVTEKPKK